MGNSSEKNKCLHCDSWEFKQSELKSWAIPWLKVCWSWKSFSQKSPPLPPQRGTLSLSSLGVTELSRVRDRPESHFLTSVLCSFQWTPISIWCIHCTELASLLWGFLSTGLTSKSMVLRARSPGRSSSTWELVRNSHSLPNPRPMESETPGGRGQS